jgi:hypothetical protein
VRDRLGAGRRIAHAIVRLVEDGATNPRQRRLSDSGAQMRCRWHTQHHQVAWLRRSHKALPGLQARMADLHKLVREGKIRPHQDIAVV